MRDYAGSERPTVDVSKQLIWHNSGARLHNLLCQPEVSMNFLGGLRIFIAMEHADLVGWWER